MASRGHRFESMVRYLVLFVAILSACSSPESSGTEETDTHPMIQRTIGAHYPKGIDGKLIAFDFRDRSYTCSFDQGMFRFTRSYQLDRKQVLDTLDNVGFRRYVEGKRLLQSVEDSLKYMEGLNGVIYFGFLPHRLQDPAVMADSIESQTIKGVKYAVLRVRFTEEGGGSDYDDEFMFWFDRRSHRMDYFAYRYVRDGGGVRFREAVNRRSVEDMLIQDYINYKHENWQMPLDSMSILFDRGALQELSRIEFQNLQVN